MRITVIAPSERLAPFVRRFTVIETEADATRALLPEQGLMLGIRFIGSATLLGSAEDPAAGVAARGSSPGIEASIAAGRAIRMPDATLTGIVGAARRMRTSAGSAVFAAFRETGAARFFAAPLHELFGRTLALDEVVPRADVARVQECMAGAADHPRRIALLEEFLLSRLLPGGADRVADAAVAAIRRAHGSLRISQLARELGISQDPLEKRFRRTVGTSPKQLASLVRLRRVIDAQRAGASWSRLAIEAGYFDQSHFNREFRAVTGEAPRQFFRRDTFCSLPLG